jgi:hypothetical protein
MRKTYFNELQAYKSAANQQIYRENKRSLKPEDALQVTLFDALAGIDAATLKIVNQKIQEIRDQYNNKIMKQSLQIDDL